MRILAEVAALGLVFVVLPVVGMMLMAPHCPDCGEHIEECACAIKPVRDTAEWV
jgi:hypothetical protein